MKNAQTFTIFNICRQVVRGEITNETSKITNKLEILDTNLILDALICTIMYYTHTPTQSLLRETLV